MPELSARDDENDIDDDAEKTKKKGRRRRRRRRRRGRRQQRGLSSSALRKVRVYFPDQRTRGERRPRSAEQKSYSVRRRKFFACGNCEAMLSLPELVARDCVVEESKLVVCGACEELTIMGGFSNSSRLAASGGVPAAHQRQRRMPTMPMMHPQPMQPQPAGMMMMMMPEMMFGGGGGHCAYPNPFGGVPFGTGMPQPRQPYSQPPPPPSSMFPPLSQENEVGSNEAHQGENAPPYFHPSRAEQSFRDATNQNQKRKY